MSVRYPAPAPPLTRREEIVDVLHGTPVPDPYRWLENQKSPETRAWLNEQIEYTDSVLSQYPGREAIEDRLTSLMDAASVSVPVERHGAFYFMRRNVSQQQYVIYKRQGLHGADEVLIDPAEIEGAADDDTTSISILDVSKDAALIAYSVRQGGEDELEIRLRCIQSHQDIGEALPRGRYFGVEIDADNQGIYYSVNTEQGPRVKYHRFGTNLDQDLLLFGEGVGPEKIIGIGITPDRSWLQIVIYHGSSGTKTEIYLLNTATNAVTTLVNSLPARSDLTICGDLIFLRTNWEAPNGRLFRLPLSAAPNDTSCWTEIVPENPLAVLQSTGVINGRIYLNYLQDVVSSIYSVDADGNNLQEIALPGLGTAYGPYGDWDGKELFFAFSSFVTPSQIWHVDAETGDSELWAAPELPIDPDALEVSQQFYTSKDGTRVPMFLVYKKGLQKDGKRPVYLTGYGGFSLPRTPSFSSLATEWAESGGIFVLVNLRGGGEYGEAWHKAGMRGNKQNVFDDLYAAAEWLIAEGYTASRHIGISGRSNGGLLVGAAITQRPDLFGAVVCGYPLLDMVRYHQFLVAGYWVPEYGSSEDAEQLGWLLSYSPYHNVKPGTAYPPIMFVTGDADTRVAPLHARKMAALMQAAVPAGSTVLLNYDVKSGHSEGKPVSHVVADTADEILFLRTHIG